MSQLAVTIVAVVITALLGGGAGGFLVAWRKDSRQVPIDEAAARKAELEITKLIDQMATNAVTKAKEQLEWQELQATQKLAKQEEKHGQEISRLHTRINQLETAMRTGGVVVPPWTM